MITNKTTTTTTQYIDRSLREIDNWIIGGGAEKERERERERERELLYLSRWMVCVRAHERETARD